MADKVSIGQLGVNEFFEDLTYNVAYSEVLGRINKLIDIDNDLIEGALKSAFTIMVSSALFLYIQKQEEFLYKIYGAVASLIIASIGMLGDKFKNRKSRLKGVRGRKGKNSVRDFFNSRSNNINFSRLATEYGSMIVGGDRNLNTGSSNLQIREFMKSNIIGNQEYKLNIANNKVSRYNETLFFKLITKNFTANDTAMIARIIGAKTKDISPDTLNKVANFMYVTDDKGEITGLTEEFMSMLNGLGYMHNKVNKNA